MLTNTVKPPQKHPAPPSSGKAIGGLTETDIQFLVNVKHGTKLSASQKRIILLLVYELSEYKLTLKQMRSTVDNLMYFVGQTHAVPGRA